MGTDYANGAALDYSSVMVAHDLSRGQYSLVQSQMEEDAYFRVPVPRRLDAEVSPTQLGSRGIR
jgi:hypothetical protein